MLGGLHIHKMLDGGLHIRKMLGELTYSQDAWGAYTFTRCLGAHIFTRAIYIYTTFLRITYSSVYVLYIEHIHKMLGADFFTRCLMFTHIIYNMLRDYSG